MFLTKGHTMERITPQPATQETPVVREEAANATRPRPTGNRTGFLTGNKIPKINRAPKVKSSEGRSAPNRGRQAVVAALVFSAAVVGCNVVTGNAEGSDKPSDRIAQDGTPSPVKPKTPDSAKASATSAAKAESTAKIESASAEIAEVESVPTVADVEMFYENGYVNVDTGDNMNHLISQFEISSDNPEQSVNNFYNDLRHNPESLGFWTACVGTGTPSYEACAENPDVLNFAEKLVADYRVMPVEQKAVHAENLIDQFKEMTFLGVPELDGTYDTVSIDENGKEIYASTNYRENDPRLRFEKDGVVFDIRGCAQITRGGDQTTEVKAPAPATPEAPSTPATPATPEAPSTPATPATPKAPSTPATPATPKAPKKPGKPITGITTQIVERSTSTIPKGSTSTTVEQSTSTIPVESTSTTVEQSTSTIPKESTSTTVEQSTSTIPKESTSTTVEQSTSTTTPTSTTLRIHSEGSVPPEATIAPVPAESTPGYTPGNAETVVGQQETEVQGGYDPTEYGTPAESGSPSGFDAAVGGDSVLDNPDYDPTAISQNPQVGATNPENTGHQGQTAGAGPNPLDPMG